MQEKVKQLEKIKESIIAHDFEQMKCLMEGIQSFEVVDFVYWHPFFIAVKHGTIEMLDYFLEEGFDINTPVPVRYEETSTLALATTTGDIEKVKFLHSKGATIDVSNSLKNPITYTMITERDGKSAVGFEEILIYLVEHGLDLSVKYKNDGGAYEYALHFGKNDYATMIQKQLAGQLRENQVVPTTLWTIERIEIDTKLMGEFCEFVYLDMLEQLKLYAQSQSEPVYALVVQASLVENFNLNLLVQTESGYFELMEEEFDVFHKYTLEAFQNIHEPEEDPLGTKLLYFQSNDFVKRFYLSLFYYAFIYNEGDPVHQGAYESSGYHEGEILRTELGLFEKSDLPKDSFLFMNEVALYCTKKLKANIDFLKKTDDFVLFTLDCENHYPEFIQETVEENKLHLFDELI